VEIDPVPSVRPRVESLVLHLFARALHPELFETVAVRRLRIGPWAAELRITTTGHLVTFRRGDSVLSEVTSDAEQPLPQRRVLLRCKLAGERSDSAVRGDMRYQVSYHRETTPPEIFWGFQAELERETRHRGLWHQFGAAGRLALGGCSFLKYAVAGRSLLVESFHTYPDGHVIAKSQSLFEAV
jgi:hypothetical protein